MDGKSKGFNNFILIFAFGVVLVFLSTYFILNNIHSKTNSPQNPSTVTPTESFSCDTDKDCVLGIKPGKCCGCPQAISISEIGKNGWEAYKQGKNYSSQLPEECSRVDCKPCANYSDVFCKNNKCLLPDGIQQIPQISNLELNKGWYFGNIDQKKTGTPSDWIFKDLGKSSCWHKPGVGCTISVPNHICPVSGWVDCMPTIDSKEGIQQNCSEEAKTWFKENCPDFQGFAY